jgi:hypothetical protein
VTADPGGFHATLIELIDALAGGDRQLRRFGAAAHRWQRRPVLDADRVAAIESAHGIRLPEDYRGYLTTVGDGGAGPYYGVLPLDHPAQLGSLRGPCPVVAADPRVDPWRGVLALADLGCDQAALLVVDGPARGTVWADARAVGAGVVPLAASFADFITAGLTATAGGELPLALASPTSCAIPRLLSALLAREEERLGREPGTLGGDDVRAVLAGLGPGAISIGSIGTVLHDPGDAIAPCGQCAVVLDNLAQQGLDRAVLAAATLPRPLRPA